jgi:hypothetical protein
VSEDQRGSPEHAHLIAQCGRDDADALAQGRQRQVVHGGDQRVEEQIADFRNAAATEIGCGWWISTSGGPAWQVCDTGQR